MPEALAEKVCALSTCDKKFKSIRANQKFCNPKHSQRARNELRYADWPERACQWCGQSFKPLKEFQKFCSPAHSTLAANARRRGEYPQPTPEQLKDQDVIRLAEERGYIIHKPRPPEELTTTLDLERLEGRDRVKFGIVSCTHFGSKYQQVTALHEFAAYCKDQGVDYLIHAGDVEDGPSTRHRNPSEVWLHEFDTILQYTVEKGLPNVGIPWKMISGNHDDWWIIDGGADMCAAIAKARPDVEYLGRSAGFLRLGDLVIEVMHMNAGSAYAYSYKLQKHIESLAGGQKPHVTLMGNFHKFCAVYYRNVLGVQLPAFQAQTQWMRTKSLVSEVGGIILEVGLDVKGLSPVSKLEVVYTYEPKENDW